MNIQESVEFINDYLSKYGSNARVSADSQISPEIKAEINKVLLNIRAEAVQCIKRVDGDRAGEWREKAKELKRHFSELSKYLDNNIPKAAGPAITPALSMAASKAKRAAMRAKRRAAAEEMRAKMAARAS